MRIVVTGTAGVLGGKVAALLAAAGHEVRGVDRVEAPTASVPTVTADLADYDSVTRALGGAEVVVHCAAVHPWKPYRDEEYLDCNVKAVYQVAKHCAENSVRHLVFTSSIAAVGYARDYEPEEMPIPENAPVRAKDTYSLTKTLAEETLRFWHRRTGLLVWALRPPTFIPYADEVRLVSAMVGGTWAHPDDIAEAHVRAVEIPPDGFETAFLAPDVPYTADDIRASREGRSAEVVERCFPGLTAWFQAHHAGVPELNGLYASGVAVRRLGWRPTRTLAAWWAGVSPEPSGPAG